MPYFEVWKRVVGRHGLDPDGDQIPKPTARAIDRGINRRTRLAWRAWDWPDFSVTEERAYRQTWSSTKQYYRANPISGLPDDVFFIPAIGYFTVNIIVDSDPPIGTPPVTPPYTQPFTYSLDGTGNPYYVLTAPLDAYVSFDQICKLSIGRVIGIYKTNPRLDGFKHSGISFRPTENGIDLFQVSTPTIFVKHLPAPSKFTHVPFVAGKVYNSGDIVFYDVTGECYLSFVDGHTTSPPNPGFWRVMYMPEVLSHAVEAGAYADCLRESHPADKELAQVAMQNAQLAEQEYKDLLQAEIDVFMAMGQRHSYQQHRPPRRWLRSGVIQSPVWTPDFVTTLTETCTHDGMYPTPAPGPAPFGMWEFHNEIVALKASTNSPSLDELVTVGRVVESVVEIVIPVGPSNTKVRQTWQLIFGAANPSDPGAVSPLDYNSSSPKQWVRVG